MLVKAEWLAEDPRATAVRAIWFPDELRSRAVCDDAASKGSEEYRCPACRAANVSLRGLSEDLRANALLSEVDMKKSRASRTVPVRKAMPTPSGHDAYIAQAPEGLRPLLVRLRSQLARALPDADEVIAYKMPGFVIGKSVIAGYAAFSKQCGLYLSPGAIRSHAGDIAAAGLKATRTGVTFSPDKPIPDALAEKLALASRRDQGL
jgi:uncharacterized protein YdhG (YjbR/CyaY superfamily)